ncbi:MAG: hypothetical protein QM811_31050 [Pirellulales bacterium]
MSLEPGLNGRLIGRGTSAAPTNRFERLSVEADWEHYEDDPDEIPGQRKVATQFFVDGTKTVLVENDSPDISFRWSINPYRGCEHGCAYCYARPYHEYLGMNAGADFETKILVKENAPRLLRDELNKPGWTGDQIIAISGVTDCYQPGERTFRVTRGLIEVLAEARQAFGLITKNALITRDLDLLGPLGAQNLVHANISITTLDAELCRALEPRTSPPAKRLDAIRQLSAGRRAGARDGRADHPGAERYGNPRHLARSGRRRSEGRRLHAVAIAVRGERDFSALGRRVSSEPARADRRTHPRYARRRIEQRELRRTDARHGRIRRADQTNDDRLQPQIRPRRRGGRRHAPVRYDVVSPTDVEARGRGCCSKRACPRTLLIPLAS